MIARLRAVVLATVLLAAAAATAAVFLSGPPEFPVNETTSGSQVGARAHSVGGARDGTFLVWQGDDGDGTGIFARHVDPLGPGPEFQVNTITAGAQARAAVGKSETHDFVVAWSSDGVDGDAYGIAGRRYDSVGTALGTEFTLNSYATAGQEAPSVAVAADGSFAVVWESFTQDGDQSGIAGRVFDAAGVPLGTDFVINEYTTGAQSQPSAAALAGGGFVVVWESAQDGSGYAAVARKLDASGAFEGGEFVLNAYTTGDQKSVHVAANAAGGFVAVWSGASTADADGVVARSFDINGSPQTGELALNEYVTAGQGNAAVAADVDGSFVVVWDSLGQDGDSYGVFGRRMKANGTPDGTEFQLNTYTTGFQGYTNSIASAGEGSFVVAWADALQDGDGFGIFARAICVDGDGDGDCDLHCAAAPEQGCAQAAAGKAKILIKNAANAADMVKWKWGKGELTTLGAFLNPLAGTGDYRFCVYDESSASQPLFEAALSPAGMCAGVPCWTGNGTKGYTYADAAGARRGIIKAKLIAGDTGSAQIQVLAKGTTVDPPSPPLTGNVTVQFVASDSGGRNCWQTTYTVASKNQTGSSVSMYKASGP